MRMITDRWTAHPTLRWSFHLLTTSILGETIKCLSPLAISRQFSVEEPR